MIYLEQFNNWIWGYCAFVLILGLGLILSFQSRFFQIRRLPSIVASFFSTFKEKTQDERGIHPMKAFFASIGGCIGIGNIVGICTAVQIGGPGALFWTWIGALCGMLIQYSEVFLGMKYRVKNEANNYDSGPMYFLPKAYKLKWIAPLSALLLCFYAVEVFMFNVMADSITLNWHINKHIVVAALLIATVGVALGGIKRVGEVSSAIIPLFILLYVGMSFWVICHHAHLLPSIFSAVFTGAFTKQAALGSFAGSTIIITISMGLSRGAYSGDIGIGYNAIIYAESATKRYQKTAAMTIIGIFLDTFVICTMSILLILATGTWNQGLDVSIMVQEALSLHFPYMNFFMPFFLFLLGYTTILAYFVVGVKCAKFLSPKWGPTIYYTYAILALPLFAYIPAQEAFTIMSLAGALLLILNLFGIFLLRKEVRFGLDE
jgi:AGCS family alanine or glycine:cation symporter